ncbi:MAG: substrate-binding domain-containing protein [Tyzzerella sp.]|nr:substrate-binding domain-containing protein [Tyzzerella sp.]
MKKRFRVIALVLSLALLGSGCSRAPANGGESTNTNVNNTTKTENANQSKLDALSPDAYSNVDGLTLEPGSYISIIGRFSGDSYWKEVEAGAKQAVADINTLLGYKGDDKIKLTFSAPSERDNVDEQVNILDEELARYPVAIAIAAVDTTACQVQFEAAADNGIPVVTFDSGSDYADIASHVSTNNLEASKTAADKLATLMERSGEVAVFVQDSLSMTAKEREQGFVAELAASFPDVSVVSVYHLDELETMAANIAAEKNAALAEGEEGIDPASITQEDVVKYILEKNPNLKGIYATNLDTTQLVADVLASLERDDLYFVGFDGGEEQLELLKDDVVDGLVIQNPYGMGYAAVVSAARAVLELGNEAFVDSGYTWVTKDNMKEAEIKKMLY